jgi:hypothetical protein
VGVEELILSLVYRINEKALYFKNPYLKRINNKPKSSVKE